MPTPQAPRGSSRTPAGQAQHPKPRSWSRRLFRSLLVLFLVLGVGVGLAGLYHLSRIEGVVREKFEGKRWAIPARVYARPLELWVGRTLTADELERELQRLTYTRASPPERAGNYSRDKGRFLVRTRPFEFWDGKEPERFLELEIQGEAVTRLRLVNGGVLDLARLDAPLIASIYPSHHEDRVLVGRDELPELLVRTLMVVEDRNYYDHHGVDPKAILRAGWRNFQAGAVVEGGSTLTQQLVKNFFLTQERSLQRKINEMAMALVLDWRYPKDEILTAYVNEIYLAQDGQRAIHGFGLASQFYFNRRLQDLGVPEIALLVGLIKGPSIYSPRRNPERALHRRNLVIELLAENGVISTEQAEVAKQQPLGLSEKGGRPTGDYPAFMDLVRRQLNRDYKEQDLRSQGLRIFTTLDPLLQDQVEGAVMQGLERVEKANRLPKDKLEAAAVVSSTADGEILALVGGRHTDYAGFNRALDSRRSIGSLVKPVVYLAALSEPSSYSLVTRLRDEPVSVSIPGSKRWEPKNYDGRSHGRVPLYLALARSYNLATVNLGLSLGVDRVAELLKELGSGSEINAVPSLLLGATALAPIDVTQVYQSIASGGFRTPLRAIRDVLDAAGHPLTRYPLTVQPVSSPAAILLLHWAMQQVVEQGTARALKLQLPKAFQVAGKTGTTDEMRDSWFAGFSGDKVAVVWVGRDDNQPTKLTGAMGAMPLWGDIMAKSRSQALVLMPSEEVDVVRIDLGSGLQVDARCANGQELPFVKGSAPQKQADCEGATRVAGGTDSPSPASEEPHTPAPRVAEKPAVAETAPPPESGGTVSKFLRSIFKW